MEVVLVERVFTGAKGHPMLIHRAVAAGAQAFIPTSYVGDLTIIARPLRELDANCEAVGLCYGAQPRYHEIGADAASLYSQTLLRPTVDWDATAGLTRAETMDKCATLFPDAVYAPDFQTARSGNPTVMTGLNAIEESSVSPLPQAGTSADMASISQQAPTGTGALGRGGDIKRQRASRRAIGCALNGMTLRAQARRGQILLAVGMIAIDSCRLAVTNPTTMRAWLWRHA